MTPSRIHRLTLTHFRNYRAASLQTRGDMVVLVGPNGAGKTNCIEAISFLSPGRGLRRATLDDVADNQGDGSWAVSAEVEGALGLATLGTGIDPPEQRRSRGQPALPDRPRAGEFGHRVRRSPADGVADAGDGRVVHGRGVGAAAVFRSAGAGDRQPAFQPGLGAGPKSCARATASWRCAITTTTGAMRSSAKPPSSRWRWRRCAARPSQGSRRCCAPAGKPRCFHPPRSCSTAGWRTR